MKKKVGLITFHKSINYGVYLQAFALQTFLEDIGYEAEIIDYNKFSEMDKKKSVFFRIKNLKETINILFMLKFLHSKEAKKKEAKFANFSKKYFRLSIPVESYDDITRIQNNYFKFVCGSDQIWNPEYTKANPVYFLRFSPLIKRIAYAPSFGVELDSGAFVDYNKEYKKYLSEFSDISVREKTGQEIIRSICDVSAKVVVDPTLLLPAEKWKSLGKKVDLIEKKYVLFYILGNNTIYRDLAKKIYSEGEYNIVCIPTGPLWNNLKCVNMVYAGVDEFLYLVNNAEYVITDSFHGTAFSVIFNKNFSAVLRNDTKHSLCSRLEDFLDKIGIRQNCVSISDLLKIDVKETNKSKPNNEQLETWIEESKEYLIGALLKEE